MNELIDLECSDYCYSFLISSNMEAQIGILNDDCVLEMFRRLNVNDLLSIGTMNVRFSRLVIDNHAGSISRIVIKMCFDQSGTPHIIQLFGQLMHALELRFIETIVPSTLFSNDDECYISNIRNMQLSVHVFDDIEVSGFRIGEVELFKFDQFIQWIRMYQRSVSNILDFLNENYLNHLAELRFKFVVQHFSVGPFYEFMIRLNSFERQINRINLRTFEFLRHRNMTFDREDILALYRYEFKLTFTRNAI